MGADGVESKQGVGIVSKQSFLCARISALERENAELKKQADGLAEALKDAAHELNVIRARDGAPLGVSEDYWDCLTTR